MGAGVEVEEDEVAVGTGPAELVLMAAVARQHYLLGRPKVEIADTFGISRFKVARLLESARDQGLVRVEIAPLDGLDLDLSARVQEHLGLRHCLVLAPVPSDQVLAALGTRAAALLSEILTPEDVLGLPLSRAVMATVERLRTLPPLRVVQLSGAMDLPGAHASAVDLVRATLRVGAREARTFYAPFVLDDAETATALRAESSVVDGLAAIDAATHAVVGVGAWEADLSTIHAVATPAEIERARTAGAVGEIAGVLFDAAGDPVPDGLAARLITLTAAQLRTIPEVIAVCHGGGRADAVAAACRGGYVQALVADTDLAHALLRD